MRSVAQRRFTAVGRAASSVAFACNSAAMRRAGSLVAARSAARTIPYAAVTPIAGAPRTTIRRIARATSSTVPQRTTARVCGNFV
jgi:hypothetical protein